MKKQRINLFRFKLRRIARIWSIVIIVFTFIMLAGYAINWIKTGIVDPHAVDDYPPIENLIPFTLTLSVMGLAIAWRWEYLGGVINIGFFLLSLAIHFWMVSPRPYPLLVAIALPTPGVLFLICWWISRQSKKSLI
ncbi:MAG: hypothetical protein U9N08_01475 [Candidatus Caldatribacteriota bacterium]|nr:hypothetical protein [Candidatus Caldatribacteriota bacterium]